VPVDPFPIQTLCLKLNRIKKKELSEKILNWEEGRKEMDLNLDPIYIVNLVLCIIILILGYLAYRKRKDTASLYVSLGFTFFCLSHFATILMLKRNAERRIDCYSNTWLSIGYPCFVYVLAT
jgi:hypothetical protein